MRGEEWPSGANSILFRLQNLSGSFFALGKAYGQEIVPGIYLASASEKVMSILASVTVHSPVNLSPDIPAEVVKTMALLWEPASLTALGNAENALFAAWELTPGAV